MFQGITALTAVGAVLFTAQSLSYTADATRATRDQIKLSAKGQIAERFSRSVEQLGQPGAHKVDVRLGGIYSLERIMRDSTDDAPTVVEVLCAFIRTHAPRPAKATKPSEAPRSPEDIRAAVTVLGRRPSHDKTPNLDLTGAQLSLPQLSLARANLVGADLVGANLVDANLFRANLSGADLSGADLLGADLLGADLSGADLSGANLSSAELFGVDLSGADLSGADLSGAKLLGADLRGAILDDQTKLPPGVVRPTD